MSAALLSPVSPRKASEAYRKMCLLKEAAVMVPSVKMRRRPRKKSKQASTEQGHVGVDKNDLRQGTLLVTKLMWVEVRYTFEKMSHKQPEGT